MNKIILTTAAMLFGIALVGSVAAQSGRLRAGAAKVDITPKQSDLMTPTDIIRDHLFAHAIVVDDGTTCAALLNHRKYLSKHK